MLEDGTTLTYDLFKPTFIEPELGMLLIPPFMLFFNIALISKFAKIKIVLKMCY